MENIGNGFLEKCMADKGFGIYVFSWGKRDSLWGFVRGLLGILGQTRVWFCAGFRGCNPYTEGI